MLTVRLLYNHGNAVFVIPAATTARPSALVEVVAGPFSTTPWEDRLQSTYLRQQQGQAAFND